MVCLRLSISPAQALAKARARFVGENAQGREGIWEGDEIVRGARSCHLRPLCRLCRCVLLLLLLLLLLPAVCFPGCVQLTARPPPAGPARHAGAGQGPGGARGAAHGCGGARGWAMQAALRDRAWAVPGWLPVYE
jgi:hypothetical protein